MGNSEGLMLNFKIGVLKELHKRQLITREELEKALKSADRQIWRGLER